MELIQFRKKRRRIKKGVLAIILGFLAAVALILLGILIFGGAEETSKQGAINGAKVYSAVILRSEKVVITKDFDTADYLVRNGQQVKAGDPVMNVYNLGFSREYNEQLWTLRERIYAAQLGVLGEARDSELKSYDDDITETKNMLSKAVLSGNMSALEQLYGRLTGLLNGRSEYLRTNVRETEDLRALYRQEDDLLQAVDAQRVSLSAERDGVVSFYLDDSVSTLNADKIGQGLITAELINKALDKKQKAKWTGSSTSNAYRIVDPNEWYCAFLSGTSESLRIASNKEYDVEIAGYGSCKGVGVASFVNGKYVVNILKFNQNIGELLDVRAVEIRIGFSAEGMMIEKRAIQFKDGNPYIEIVTPNGRANVYVDVLAEDSNNAIIRIREGERVPEGTEVRYWVPKRGKKR